MIGRLWRHPVVRSLAGDRFVQAYGAVFALTAGVYLAPLATPAFMEAYGRAPYLVPFVAVTVLASFSGISRLEDREERRFWKAISISCLAWLLALFFYSAVPVAWQSRSLHVFGDTIYLLSYLPLLIAVEWRPHHGVPLVPWEPDRWSHAVSASLVAGGWFVYFVLIPAWFDESFYGSSIPTYLLYLVLDSLIVALYFFVGRRCVVPRWRTIYWAIGASTFATLIADALDLLAEGAVLLWQPGTPADLLWCLPSFAYLVAIRLRHAPLGPPGPVEPGPAGFSLRERARSGGLVLAGAFSFPLVHLWLHKALPLSPGLRQAQSILVLVMLLLLGGVAVATYGLLGRRHRELEAVRRGLRERLREAQRLEAIGRLAGGVAHDFNNMLTSIVGYNEMALDTLPADDANRPALEQIAQSATRASELTQQLLALSRRQILRPARINLTALIKDFGPLLARVIGEDVRLETRLDPQLKDVVADPQQMRTAIFTLAANARDAMPSGGRVVISTANVRLTRDSWPIDPGRTAGGYVELRVSDSGPGIPEELRPHVFEPFSAAGGQGRGTGLGLAAVHGIVTQSAGTIDVENCLGGGVEFVIRLPRADATVTLPSPR